MGNSFSGIPSKIEEVDLARLRPEQRDFVARVSEAYKHQTIDRITTLLNDKVPGYFEPPKSYPQVSPSSYFPRPGSFIPLRPPASAPPAPSLAFFHPYADLLRRLLFLHIFSDQFGTASVPRHKLFAESEDGRGDGKLRNAYVCVLGGIQVRNRAGGEATKVAKSGELSDEDKEELLDALPTLSKLRVLVSTSVATTTASDARDAKNKHMRILTAHVEIIPFTRQNKVIRPPGIVALEVRFEQEFEWEMRFLAERKDWDWVVEVLREVLRAVIGIDGGVWDFMRAKYEGVGVALEGEGVVKCYVVRDGGV